MALKGKIIVIGETQAFGDNGFKKREWAIKTDEQYPQEIGLECVQDKCELLDKFEVGDNVSADINLRGRAWTNDSGVTKYFNTLQAWRIVKDGEASSSTPPETPPEDDLPF